ncbi:hypothetical protein JCM19233_2635 [Vibrio astriarenae]|nr:hypothetical protein JCM19233_2635 [Vibrio sp. C7]
MALFAIRHCIICFSWLSFSLFQPYVLQVLAVFQLHRQLALRVALLGL